MVRYKDEAPGGARWPDVSKTMRPVSKTVRDPEEGTVSTGGRDIPVSNIDKPGGRYHWRQEPMIRQVSEITENYDILPADRRYQGTEISVTKANPTGAPPETDAEVMARKLSESSIPRLGYKTSLLEHIQGGGSVKPIFLARMRAGLPSMVKGKKGVVAGGHHRLAVMSHLNPDQYAAVTHVNHPYEAGLDPDYE